jgi:F0F1-type ATP synthase membrane subunit c/vacuolar-type H+-ATPase subunit K
MPNSRRPSTGRISHHEEETTMRSIRSAALLIIVAALPVALAACSSGSPQATAGAHSSSPTSAADPDAGLLTGTELKADLAPASLLGSGFALDASGSRDTGNTYESPTTTTVNKPDCTKIDGTSWTAITGINGVSFAQNDYIDKNTSAEVAQEIDVYRGTTAQSVLNALGKLATLCPSFTDAQTSSTVTVTEAPTTGLGDGAYTITLTDNAWQTGSTLVAARVGTAVVSVLSTGDNNGVAAATQTTTHLISALKGKA